MRLILLGTGGGPRPRQSRYPSSHVIVIGGAAYVVDCGNGVAFRMAEAGVPMTSLRHIFITHHHSDHNADFGNLFLIAWATGLKTRVDAWGPPPLARMTRLFFEMNATDLEARVATEGRPPLPPLIHAHEQAGPGVVMEDENVKVTCAVVDHPATVPAFAYRFDGEGRSIVISGDTTPSEALVKLAEGADVLVHEALYVPGIDRLAARVPNAATLREHLLRDHTPVEDAGRVAQAAGVKKLVLSHLVPADDPEISEAMWVDAARGTYKGDVVLGRDLLEV